MSEFIDSIVAFGNFLEKYPVIGAAILSLVVAGVIGIVRLFMDNRKDKNSYHYVKPYYWGFSNNFYITTVLEFIPNDAPNSSPYTQIQYSRPDQWGDKVLMKSYFKIFHKIIPLNEKDILSVLVRKKRKEKHVLFNRQM
jgi:hypothetical protein